MNATTEATQMVAISHRGAMVEVKGRVVAPGLAITPVSEEEGRYCLTHIPSGLAALPSRCAEHIEIAAQMATGVGIDWTADKDTVVANPVVKATVKNIVETIGHCYGRCNPSTPAGPSWAVRCNTCDWQWEDEYNEGPLDAKEAKRIAQDHECEPEVEISPPDDSNEWFVEWLVNDDGTIGKQAQAA